jgi:hypothetical protein
MEGCRLSNFSVESRGAAGGSKLQCDSLFDDSASACVLFAFVAKDSPIIVGWLIKLLF